MGGLLPNWETVNSKIIRNPVDAAEYWDKISKTYEMPLDGDVWLEDPLPSSYPVSIAFKAAAIQDPEKAVLFLRKVREMLFLEKRNVTRWKYLAAAARHCGLDDTKLSADAETIGIQMFEDDLKLGKDKGVIRYPTLIFYNEHGESEVFSGMVDYKRLVTTIHRLDPTVVKHDYPKDENFLFRTFSCLTTKEFADLMEVSFENANQQLDKLARKNKINSKTSKNGKLWFLMNYAIIGGGLAGLAMALELETLGLEYTVFERAPSPDGRGHGFIIPHEGINFISRYVDQEKLFAAGNLLAAYHAHDQSGNRLNSVELPQTLAISRQALVELYISQIPQERLKFKSDIEQFHFENESIKKLSFKGGFQQDVDFLIGADGINSSVRNSIFPQAHLESVQENEIVNTIDSPEMANIIGKDFLKYIHTDGGLALGVIRISATKIIWYVQFDPKRFRCDYPSPITIESFIKTQFKGWNSLVDTLIDSTDFKNSYLWRVYELKSLPSFYKANVLLIGDAAHPLIPLTSQGVTSAIRDARMIGDMLQQENSIDYIMREFTQVRSLQIEKKKYEGTKLLLEFLSPMSERHKMNVPIIAK
jgi:2-polyprenyl-6-methoxyphenol hydroxylase-like FAD-dependent oxidoreductase/predicted DsbA family dithiol-disulfide isomerase